MDKQSNNHTLYRKPGVSLPTKQTSMCSLIIWNISKALEKNPSMDLGLALRSAHERVERETSDTKMITQPPEHRHLTCALLAWQHLGHENAESLHKFVLENRNKTASGVSENRSNKNNIKNVIDANISVKQQCSIDQTHSQYSKNFDTCSLMGPVVKLPVDTKIVMRVENTLCPRHSLKKTQKDKSDTMNKIDAACCKDSACVQRLTDLDNAVSDLRTRAARLAKREADRVELLERAEAAWKDLERGYQRRLTLCEEKEDDMIKQIQKLVDERNGYKTVCTTMAQTLKERGDNAENDRFRLSEIEKNMCDRACVRMRLSEESARGDSSLADQLCRVTQLDRDLQFKEEQTRRKLLGLEGEVDSRRGLTHEAERAMRAELSALKEQLSQVSKQLLAEESENNTTKMELESLRQEKSDIIEDLDGCKVMCDNRMQGRIDELKKKREQLNELKEKVMDCRCKLPQDASVEVKRTPSLAALCYCSPEDKILESCSCTSLRSQLLSNLLADLFGGLQSELGGSGSLMPCQLLKCLEDRHNWDRSSLVKTNLLKFFGQLLTGELDIAIATSIEKYHAKWVGASCADLVRVIPDPGDILQNEGWQERAIERRAQKLATQLAEQLFKERSEQLTKRAKDIMSTGPPPCECKPQAAAVFPCLVKQPTLISNRKTNDTGPSYLKRAMQDVTLLRTQIEDLKKDSIKKEDLRKMEEKITKIVQRVSKVENNTSTSKNVKLFKEIHDETKYNCTDNVIANVDPFNFNKKTKTGQDSSKFRKIIKCPLSQTRRFEKNSDKLFKKIEQSFAVNLCLCGEQKVNKQHVGRLDLSPSFKPKKRMDIMTTTSNVRRSKPISLISSKEHNFFQESKHSNHPICPSDCVCFHKMPSNTSIDRLLETLTKWKGDLNKMTPCNKENISEKDENDGNIITQIVTRPSIDKKNVLNYNIVNGLTEEYKGISDNSSDFNHNIVKLSSNEVRNKFTTYDTGLPAATESEYIGAINLDKSNDVFCKCNRNTGVKHGDGVVAVSNIRFQCINTDSCHCKKSAHVNSNESEKINKDKNYFQMKKESQVYSKEKESQSLSIDFKTDTPSTQSNKKGVEISREFIKDVVKKSDLFPCNCDYNVKFLGVTLVNTKTNNKLQENSDNNRLLPKYVDGATAAVNGLNKNDSMLEDLNNKDKYNLRCDFNSCEYGDELIETLHSSKKGKSLSLDIIEKKEGTCVCCGQSDLPSELEVNVFNLLEEHLKGKFDEFQRSVCKTSCLPADEEKHLFSNILNKVKQVISESTVKLTCKCVQEKASEGSWSRAYGLLQEYLKIKIKRVQCTCISSDKNTESILPGILEKVNNLIEHDFKRLKDKCLSENKNNYSTIDIINNQLTKKVQENQDKNETFVQFDMRDTDYLKDKLLQASKIFCCNKSCETIDNKLFNVNTLEKKVSCELHRVYGTQCDCRYTFNDYFQLNKESIVNRCIDLIPNQDKAVSDMFNGVAGASSTNYSSMESSIMSKENKEEKERPKPITKHPYIGYTLNCSCDRALGNCHCSKSMVETNNENIEFIWKSLTNDLHPKKISYIMPKIVTNVRSKNSHLNKNNECYCTSESIFKRTDLVIKDDKQCCDIEINTINNEDIKLKDFEEKFASEIKDACTTDKINTETDLNTETMLFDCGLHSLNGSKYSTDTSTEKNKLYHSLFLPTENYSKNANFDSHLDGDLNVDSDSDKCNCKMVPICHVKMLVDNIEKKLNHSKCTCDALLSPASPINNDFY